MICTYGAFYKKGYGKMICPNCKKENVNEYATVCAYCGQPLYSGENAEAKAVELSAKQKKDKMKSVIIAIISVILAIIVAIVALLIPKSNKDDDTTTTESTTESTTLADSEESTTNNGGAVNEETTTKKNADSSKNDPNVMDTTEEILTYFNTNANRVKTEATKVVKHYEDREVKEIVAPKAFQGMVESMVTTFMADDTDPVEYTTREEIVENFQVPKQSYVSCLKVSDIEKASCKDMGTYYEITITVKSEDNPSAGKGVGAAFDVIEPEEVEGKSDMVEDFSTRYSNCTVVAKFDKSTNRMTHANYMIPTKLMLTINFAGTHNASIDMSFEKDYTITY